MRAFLLLLASSPAAALHAAQPPACNLTGGWCCEPTAVVQGAGGAIATSASYGTGAGILSGRSLAVNFSNAPGAAITGTVDAACGSIAWDNGASWTRSAPPWPGPATPPPAWVRNLSIYELNPRAFTSPAGAGGGSGSGTWASLTARLPHLQGLGVTGLWVAGSALAEAHFYGIWSTYATTDVRALDPVLGTAVDFAAFVDAAHAAGMRVFLDVTTHGICNDSALVAEHPDWFAGSSWGMRDYAYANASFFAFWSDVWVDWVTRYRVDGFRLDIADTDGELAGFDAAARAGAAIGHDIAVWGESRRYHFMQHDTTFSVADWSDVAAAFAPTPCYETLQFSCHDAGWESAPGNYLTFRGSRAWFGYAGVFSYQIPLFLGGEEYDEDPVVGLPDLAKDLYGGGGPGGWMYGSQRQWAQLANASKAAMLADVSAMFAAAAAHADVIHRDRCSTAILHVPVVAAPGSGAYVAVPYARYLAGAKAVLVFANADAGADAALTAAVPLSAMGLAGRGEYTLLDLYAGAPTRTVTEAELAALAVRVPRDMQPRGGLAVLLVEPVA